MVLADGAAVGQQRDLGGDGEADPLVADVVLAVVAAEEDVTQDPEAAGGLDAHEAGQAHGLVALLDLENVVLALQGVVLAAEGEVDDGQVGDLVAVDHALAGQGVDLGADGLVDGRDVGGGAGDEAGAGVHHGLAPAGAHSGTLSWATGHGNAVHLDLPVAEPGQCDVAHLSSEEFIVSSSQNQLAAVGVIGIPVEPESEDGCVHLLLHNHRVEHSWDSVDGDGVPSHAQDSVELGGDEGYSGLLDGLGEALVFNADAGHAHSVDGDESLHGAGAVLDGEVAAVLGVRRRLGRVVLVVALAGDVEPSAGGGGNPQVAGAGVEDDGELLAGGSDLNLSIVLGIHVVDEVLLWDLDVSGTPPVGDPLPGLEVAAKGPGPIQPLQLN